MSAAGKLADYPALLRWYEDQQRHPGATDRSGERLATKTCEALRDGGGESIRVWLQSFDAFLNGSSAPLSDFRSTEEIFERCDAGLLDVIGDFAETAVRQGQADAFLRAMRHGAEATGLVVLRFLAAWTALNAGQPGICIEESEKIDEPFAAVYTIHGQALLETQRAAEAAEVLAIAVKLAPSEILAWFQLAKARHVLGRTDEAWTALAECHALAPQSDEVALFRALVALDTPRVVARMDEAWTSLRPRMKRHLGNAGLAATLMKLAIHRQDRGGASTLVDDVPWAEMLHAGVLTRELPSILRLLHGAAWHDVAASLLRRVTPEEGSPS
jgi:tetratricopeptide (TPR) repeat protein